MESAALASKRVCVGPVGEDRGLSSPEGICAAVAGGYY